MAASATILVHELIETRAQQAPEGRALVHADEEIGYGALWNRVSRVATGFASAGLARHERVAVYLDKRVETVTALFAATAAGGVFVPVNPLLKPRQVAYILRNCDVSLLVTTPARLRGLRDVLEDCPALGCVALVPERGGAERSEDVDTPIRCVSWQELESDDPAVPPDAGRADTDVAAILYTSGSTGPPKGVVLSHRNLVTGAQSVSGYLRNRPSDRILAVLPLSFDAGLSQLTTGFSSGATVVLLNYLFPRDVVKTCARQRITGITGVPPLWLKLAQESWPTEASDPLRYFANTGGKMPRTTLATLRSIFPKADPFLMYGLTEAFRSTYLDPSEVERRPDSIGKAIPNAEIHVVDAEGEECPPGVVGELVHRGPLVSLGYWNDPEATARRFRPAPGRSEGDSSTELAVWSGDLVRRDEDGFLTFVARGDDMIKTDGYRVSPSEIEEVVDASGLVTEAAAFGVPHPELGQHIVVIAAPPAGQELDAEGVLDACRRALPRYMVPHAVHARSSLPRNPNGKIDRAALRRDLLGDEHGDAA